MLDLALLAIAVWLLTFVGVLLSILMGYTPRTGRGLAAVALLAATAATAWVWFAVTVLGGWV